MNIQEMKEKKKEKGYTNEQIAELSGVPLGTVQKIFGGTTTSPRYDTLKALEKIFLPMERYYASVVKDASAAYTVKRQGEYTVEDYYALPDEQRAELIDGVLYDMASPETLHQMVGGYIYARFLEFISKNKGNCIPLIAPLDVQLDCDNKTIVEPDVMIVCDRDKLYKNRIYGAPEFILEVLSKSTRRRDMVIKLQKYAKLIPIITGSADPMRKLFVFIKGNNCNNVVSADITSAACIKITESSCESPATPATMIDGVTHPTIIASTCWIASGSACPIEGFP